MQAFKKENRVVFSHFGVLLVFRFLKKQMGKKFESLKAYLSKVRRLEESLKVVESKQINDISFGFAKIRREWFEQTKRQIND